MSVRRVQCRVCVCMVSQACAVSCASGTPDDWGALSPPPTLCVADVFHWTCLNELAARLPPNTAPAGYQCPACQAPVFPPANLASPVADVLRQKLSTVNWARAGLGLPLIEEAADVPENPPHDVTDYTDWSTFDCESSGAAAGEVRSSQPLTPRALFAGRNRSGTKRTALTLKQRVLLVLLLGVLGFVTLVVVMSKLGRASADSDPNLDPHLNPHIRVGQN
nr:PREDICTED: zinc finger protein-like 1 [Lepisosteus oculatus]